jgi:hypothetical protein
MVNIYLEEKIEDGRVIFTPKITELKNNLKEYMLYELLDKVIDRAIHYNKNDPSLKYEIKCGELGLGKDEVERIFNSYMKDKTYVIERGLWQDIAITYITLMTSLAPSMLLPSETFRAYSHIIFAPTPIVVSFLTLWRIGEYFHNRKARKFRNILQRLSLKE